MNTRKENRLKDYDYSRSGVYFITICVKDRRPLLSRIDAAAVGASIARPGSPDAPAGLRPELSEIGMIVDHAIRSIPVYYTNASVDNYVIMPNHVHLLIRIDNENGRAMPAPTGMPAVSGMVQQLKGYVTKQCGEAIWQKSFHDHVIRCEQDYLNIWNYIDGNPLKWCEDEYFCSLQG